MKIGYVRVSTQDQNLDIQNELLKEAGCERIYKETVSGAKRARTELQRLLDSLRPDDTVIVWKLDRLARSTRDLLDITDTIQKTGAKFTSLSEPWADTTSPANKMVMTVFSGIAEFERELIRERTTSGRIHAQKRGVQFGRPQRLSVDQKELAHRLLEEGKSVRQVATTFGVHVATIYRLQPEKCKEVSIIE
jgi:DNA invertase Pin-like site-specific DNA recombinase